MSLEWSLLGSSLVAYGAASSPSYVIVDRRAAISEKNIESYLGRFVKTPHPMGSDQQLEHTQALFVFLKSLGLKTEKQMFSPQVPDPTSKTRQTKKVQAANIIAVREGRDDCVVILGGHSDTKAIPGYLGANDGGSSTTLLLELARVASLQKKKKSEARWGDCDVAFAFFDGEESQLLDWSEGESKYGVVDHLYGSRAFVDGLSEKKSLPLFQQKPITLLISFDMIGHKQQNLIASAGSDEKVFQQLASRSKELKLKLSELDIEDDHVPFRQKGIRFVHLIDWTNLREWHTTKDTLEVLSTSKIASLAQVMLAFLEEKRVKP